MAVKQQRQLVSDDVVLHLEADLVGKQYPSGAHTITILGPDPLTGHLGYWLVERSDGRRWGVAGWRLREELGR